MDWPYRLMVRTTGFQSVNLSSILSRVTKCRIAGKLLYLRALCEGIGIILQKQNSRAGVGKHLRIL